MVQAVRDTEKALGEINYCLTPKQVKSREHGRSLYVVEDIKAGEIITEKNVRSIRPAFGLHPKYYAEILGKTVKRDLPKGSRMSLDEIE